ncbi:MAG TPA: dolichyl-phosphate beta-glucosyltransferase [Thermoanaerobaculia bacterium]|nr:dolichyl-phosphate beta-glucosyltransferase [Thermoanaerobaculia bacterium]
MSPELSIVVPAYNEGERLGPTLRRLLDHLVQRGDAVEVLVVDDGSRDATAEVARGFAAEGVRLLAHRVNRGKGAAVRTGLAASRGRRVLITDADLSTPIEDLALLEPHLGDAELVLGSRGLAASRISERQPLYREMMGKMFNRLVRLAGVRGIRDTQCGFKLLDGEAARRIAGELTVERFAYDVELVFLARRLGYRVREVGVNWADSPASRVHPLFDSLSMLSDLVRIRWRHRRRGR